MISVRRNVLEDFSQNYFILESILEEAKKSGLIMILGKSFFPVASSSYLRPSVPVYTLQ